ncbi:hypothetical protein [Nonomuraea sp. NPDC050783]|uniref:hypothetical protein n=1 Tax=Nonomuraea sp. NPDC050783 TaxID=3154634 RepID=UPI003465E822
MAIAAADLDDLRVAATAGCRGRTAAPRELDLGVKALGIKALASNPRKRPPATGLAFDAGGRWGLSCARAARARPPWPGPVPLGRVLPAAPRHRPDGRHREVREAA